MASKPRTEEEKKEIYKRWCELINMSEGELKAWAKNPSRLKASLNRARAKENGGIQSGLDSLHRIKRRYSKPRAQWSDRDYDNASQENSFNSRMLGNDPGKVVSGTGMSKWEISLRNWGHDPSKKSSPAYSKWRSWKESNNDSIKKTASESHSEVVQELVSTYIWEKMTFNNYLKRASEVLAVDIEKGLGAEEVAKTNDIVYAIMKNPEAETMDKEAAHLWERILQNEAIDQAEEQKDDDAIFLLCQIILKNKFKQIQHSFGNTFIGELTVIDNLLEEGLYGQALSVLKKAYDKPSILPYTGGPLSTRPDYGSQIRIATKRIFRRLKTPIEK